MAKTIKIKVEETGKPAVQLEIIVTGNEPTDQQWEEILEFEDKHIGGRPKDR